MDPTGVVFNNTAGFQVEPGKKAAFIFGSEDGSEFAAIFAAFCRLVTG